MGRDKTAPKGKAKSPAVCPCQDPFAYPCSCGNRPERPSRGHKWDVDSKTWTGKGHRQKGGGLNGAQTAVAAVVTEVGGVTIEQWQKTPVTLLLDYCKGGKRPSPKFKDLGNSNQGHRYRVILPDLKKPDKDLIYVSSSSCKLDEQAREEGALLVLLTLCPSMPYELKLPEPYKTPWLNITGG